MVDIEVVGVESNVDALSAERLHRSLVKLIDEVSAGSAEFLRGAVPKDTGAMAEHVSHEEPIDLIEMIEAAVGIRPVGESEVPGLGGEAISPRFSFQPSDRSHYPLFVDQGTGIFGDTGSRIFARTSSAMRFERDGEEVFARSVAGQRGQHFMAETYAFARHLLIQIGAERIRFELDLMATDAATRKPAEIS